VHARTHCNDVTGMSRDTRNLTSEEIWVTEYNPQYGTCCGVRNPCAAKEDAPLENEKASSEIEAYPRLVRRDATPAVVITDEPGRSRGPSLQSSFHSVVAWPNWKLGLGVLISCAIPWTISATIYYVLDCLNVVASMGPDGYQTDDSWTTSFFLTAYTATSVGYVSTPPPPIPEPVTRNLIRLAPDLFAPAPVATLAPRHSLSPLSGVRSAAVAHLFLHCCSLWYRWHD